MRRIRAIIAAPVLAAIIGGLALAQDTVVKMATLPYLDYTGFVGAHALGLDKQQGIELQFVPFPLEAPATQALERGSIDVGQGALGSLVPILPQATDLRVVMNDVQFKGFVFVGREGKIKAFSSLLSEYDGDFQKAQQATLEQFKGQTFVLVKSSFEGILKSTLEQVGLTLDDVKVLDFQNDAQAAAAFLRGTGDLYTGSLPQEIRILKEPGYVAVAGNEVLGPAGLWYSNTFTTAKYLADNHDTVMKLIAVYYRFMRYLSEEPDKALPPMIDYLNKQASSNVTLEDEKAILSEFEDFATVESSKSGVYDPNSALYWRKAMQNFVTQNESLGKIPQGAINIDDVVVQEKLFNELLNNKELMDWINSPLD